MSVDFKISVGNRQHADSFNFHQIHTVSNNNQRKRLTIYEMEATLITDIRPSKGQYTGLLQLTESDAEQIREVECLIQEKIRDTLDNSAYCLKSEVSEDHKLSFRLAQIKGQITCKCSTGSNKFVSYAELTAKSKVIITLRLDTIWARDDCYGNFLYKWKAIKIHR